MPTPFETAVKKNNQNFVHDLLTGARPLPIDIRNEASQTGLMISCAHNSVKTVKAILVKYQELENHTIDDTDTLGWTALHHSAKSGSLECIKLLLENKAEIDVTTDKNETPLFLATKHNHPDIVEFLAEKSCLLKTKAWHKIYVKYDELTAKKEEFSAIEVAIENNFEETTKCLLLYLMTTKGLNGNELNGLLKKAVGNGHTKIANELLVNGANVNCSRGFILNYFWYIHIEFLCEHFLPEIMQ
jgi:hypothetical protein